MPKTRPPHPSELRRQMVELVRAGRDPEDLAREFEPSRRDPSRQGGSGEGRCRGAQSIRAWVLQAERAAYSEIVSLGVV